MSASLPSRILLVDDSRATLELIGERLEQDGYGVHCASSAAEAFTRASQTSYDIVITDLVMPQAGGMEVLAHFAEHYPETIVILLTGYATIETAVEAMKRGAFDYLTKPAKLDEIILVLKRAQELTALRAENVLLRSQLRELCRFDRIIGKSHPMQALYKMIERVAKTDSTVLILGESGTGKELIANAIHINSPRKGNPLIKINCAAIAENLMESELFGYEKGAFTGAVVTKPGRFELAHKGTLFLDEVGELPKEMQVKLLRVIQEQTFERVGGLKTIKVDVRLITATNRNLFQDVKEGRFREDLFYRLNVLPIHLPALRERRDDIPTLIAYFVDRFRKKLGRDIQGLEYYVLDLLINYDWPGNIREMENLLERLVLMARGQTIAMADVPGEIKQAVYEQSLLPPEKKPSQFKEFIRSHTEEAERQMLARCLEECGGNVTRAAQQLGLSRKGLQLKMIKYNLRK